MAAEWIGYHYIKVLSHEAIDKLWFLSDLDVRLCKQKIDYYGCVEIPISDEIYQEMKTRGLL